jgi:hypothetical protein
LATPNQMKRQTALGPHLPQRISRDYVTHVATQTKEMLFFVRNVGASLVSVGS